MDKKIEALTSNDTWECVPLLARKKAITSKWVYKVKLKADGSIEKLDINNTFLHGALLEEVYMKPPQHGYSRGMCL
ncbi:hypothetical protein LIER_21303 [Lithospermum erythrorhizon]|uniref:Reverse transcriptase Ty1/copia-type domain-containing protein n=1 Tax=Lithospermum erythrorhizon TaxID=34254 RepID=A0AAV3QT77_LITER